MMNNDERSSWKSCLWKKFHLPRFSRNSLANDDIVVAHNGFKWFLNMYFYTFAFSRGFHTIFVWTLQTHRKKMLTQKRFDPIPAIYLHLIFAILQFEISSLMNWIFLPAVACKIQVWNKPCKNLVHWIGDSKLENCKNQLQIDRRTVWGSVISVAEFLIRSRVQNHTHLITKVNIIE